MKNNKVFLTAILSLGIMYNAHAGMLETEMLNSYIENTSYQVPTAQNLQTAQMLFESVLKDKIVKPQDAMAWSNLGFTLKQLTEGAYNYAVISETNPAQGKGHGFYVIKLNGAASQNILEAPHRPSDLYTHQIIYKLLIEGNYLAAAWNTTNRTNVDFGKHTSSYYNAFTIAVAKVLSAPKLIQLHAFDASSIEVEGDIILSSTTKTPSTEYGQVANCLKTQMVAAVPLVILQYPQDVQELGGTLNINAKKFYETNANGKFYHVETSKLLRQLLRDMSSLRSSFSKCFIGS